MVLPQPAARILAQIFSSLDGPTVSLTNHMKQFRSRPCVEKTTEWNKFGYSSPRQVVPKFPSPG